MAQVQRRRQLLFSAAWFGSVKLPNPSAHVFCDLFTHTLPDFLSCGSRNCQGEGDQQPDTGSCYYLCRVIRVLPAWYSVFDFHVFHPPFLAQLLPELGERLAHVGQREWRLFKRDEYLPIWLFVRYQSYDWSHGFYLLASQSGLDLGKYVLVWKY
jgi:hypothetical protein